MTRVLKRPMFRLGGPANEGITSGLAPRQGYQGDGMSQLVKQLPELRRIAKEESYQPRGVTPADALIEFGLDVASRPPSGSIFSTAAASAKEPFQRYSKSKAETGLQKYASEADMFKTLIGAQAKILGSEGGSKIFSKQQAASAMSGLLGEWQDLRDKQDEMDAGEFEDQKAIIWGQIMQYQKENPAIASLFKDIDFAESVKSKIKSKLKKSTKEITTPDGITMTEQEYYKENPDELMLKVGQLYIEYYNDMMTLGGGASLKSGGRVGYQNAGPVMGQPTPDETMPEGLGSLGYEELRARLPQEVTDDIVQLLANSAEALEDFATIQTEQDVANFNKKYSVNLVLPAEG